MPDVLGVTAMIGLDDAQRAVAGPVCRELIADLALVAAETGRASLALAQQLCDVVARELAADEGITDPGERRDREAFLARSLREGMDEAALVEPVTHPHFFSNPGVDGVREMMVGFVTGNGDVLDYEEWRREEDERIRDAAIDAAYDAYRETGVIAGVLRQAWR